jgi:hypothetical protein
MPGGASPPSLALVSFAVQVSMQTRPHFAVSVPIILTTVALLAVSLPTARAAKVDPMQALRAEFMLANSECVIKTALWQTI